LLLDLLASSLSFWAGHLLLPEQTEAASLEAPQLKNQNLFAEQISIAGLCIKDKANELSAFPLWKKIAEWQGIGYKLHGIMKKNKKEGPGKNKEHASQD
jgi:hypothetical protein